MTIATQITRIQTAKSDARTAIEAKGVTVAPELTLDAYPAKIAEITTGGGGGEWTKPADWIDISTVADNEINLLVTEGSGFAFTCTVADSGTFSVDWGDGTIDHNCTSGAVQQHIHTTGGTPWTATGGHTWKVRVYNATAEITTWKIARHTYTNRRQCSPLLWAVVGAQGLTDCSYMFYNTSGQQVQCTSLVRIEMTSFENCTTLAFMCSYCLSLSSVVLPATFGSVNTLNAIFLGCVSLCKIALPSSFGLITTLANAFFDCTALQCITFPSSFGLITTINSAFYNCKALKNVIMPESWGSLSVINSAFYGCNSLVKIVFPTSIGNVTSSNNVFNTCYSLKEAINFEYLGSNTSTADFTDILRDCENLQTPIVCGSLLSKFGAYGASGYVLKIPSIRLTNAGSTFTGSSPQINVSYTSLSASALENLFNDLPTLSSKTINITGCTGAASLTSTQLDIAYNKGWNVVY